jgi:succinate dehydrogenase flavin-adding protein (antitoxin of CptAB toxin-antitoxin module)
MWIECGIASEIHIYQSWSRLVGENDDIIQQFINTFYQAASRESIKVQE